MPQRLILPIDDCQLNAGYKMSRYAKEWGYPHYGIDLGSISKTRQITGMGNGVVVACGMDGNHEKDRLGNCIVIVFKNVLLNDGKTVADLACRMFHLAKINCKTGDTVDADKIIGEYGNTGGSTSGPHLHIEFDTDIKYPQYAVGIKSSGKVIKKGTTDSTINPAKVFWLDKHQIVTSPEAWIAEGWVLQNDLNMPGLPSDSTDREKELEQTIIELMMDNDALRAENNKLNNVVAKVKEAIEAE